MSDARSGKSVRVNGLEIEPIERVVVHVENVFGGIVGMGLKEPIAVVIRSPAGAWRVEVESLAER